MPAGQGDERVGELGHQRLALVHRADHPQVGRRPVWPISRSTSACGITPITSPPAASAASASTPISPTCAAAVDDADAAPRQHRADSAAASRVGRVGARVRAAEDADALTSTNGSPGSAARRGPVSQRQRARAYVGQRPVVAAAAVPSKTASSGAYSRVWSVCGASRVHAVVGGQHEQVVGRPALEPARRPPRRSRAARRGSPRRPCGARRPGRCRPGSRTPARRRARPAAAWSRRSPSRCWRPVLHGRSPRRRTGRGSSRRRAPARRHPAAPPGTARPAAARVVAAAPRAAPNRPARPRTAARSPARPRARRPSPRAPPRTPRTARLVGTHVHVRGDLQDRVGRRVQDQLAGLAGDARRRRSSTSVPLAGPVAAEAPRPVARSQRVDHSGGKPFG